MSFSIRRIVVIAALSMAAFAFLAGTAATVSGSSGNVVAEPAHSDGAIWG